MSRRRTPARWAAPAALVASAVAVFLVVRGGTPDDGARAPAGESAPATAPRTTPPTRTGTTTTRRPAGDGPATYTVQAGDTLSAIAAETGVPVEDLLRLNPDIDPSSLRVGEQLELRDE